MVIPKLNSREAKAKIIKLMKTCVLNKIDKNKQNLINFLQECSINTDLNFLSTENKTQYRYCGPTRSPSFAYCISNEGKLLVINTNRKIFKNGDLVNIKMFSQSKEILLKNGYISPENQGYPYLNNHDIKLAVKKNIYLFMKEAKWLEKEQSVKDLAKNLKDENFPLERLEIHHINNNPNDNRVDNLIYLPRSIHCHAHKYIHNKNN